ncbi:alpha/beta hydrolase [Nocardia sp. BSTN01]|uniref:alpha/beta fold hydrolase n=1 Tax=Nocardia sp. BSTN01 TaxID=2783665 RepID=UPI00188EB28A|nr:alpha/beta hydrolase [Nocardia sp. BSTN01]MBF5000854.1 alpha/beta hydrolase [Nocardia sp. BSTN01]
MEKLMVEAVTAEKIDAYDLGYIAGSRLETEDGVHIYYERYGIESPTTIVLIPNLFLIAPLWRNFSAELATKYSVVSYDMRNKGASTQVDGVVDFERHIHDLRAVLTHLGVERPYLVASSDSTLLAREYALAYPDEVGGLALYGPVFNAIGGRRRRRLIQAWLSTVTNVGPTALFNEMYPLIYSHHTVEFGGSPAYLALKERFIALSSQQQLITNLKTSLTVSDEPDRLRQIACPVLLSAGENDFQTSAAMMGEVAAIMPDAEVEVIPNSGHAPYFEATAEFEASIDRFVRATLAR